MKKSFIYAMTIVASIVMLLAAQLSAQGTATSTQGTSAPPQTASTAKPQQGKPVVPPPVLTVEPDYRIGVATCSRSACGAKRRPVVTWWSGQTARSRRR